MKKLMLAVIVACAFLAGCTTYYQVKDPSTGKEYYTTRVQKKASGAVVLVDAKTGAKVTVQNSEIREISKERFKEGPAGE